MTIARMAASGLLAVVLVACTADDGSTGPRPATSAATSGAPTPQATGTAGAAPRAWPKPFAQTTCAEWNGQLSPEHKILAATELLISGWRSEGINRLPALTMVERFAQRVAGACAGDAATTMTLAEVGARVYKAGSADGTGEWTA